MRRILGAAIAIGAWTSSHRIIASLAVVVVLAAIVGGSTFGVLARGSGQTFPGTSAAGSHSFYSLGGDIEADFCNACHSAIRTELTTGPHKNTGMSSCVFCHPSSGGAHVAQTAMCADCHDGGSGGDQAAAVLADAHGSFYGTIGETQGTASWSCKACHTEVSVAMTVTNNPDLPLALGPTYP